MTGALYAGIDLGSSYAKAVVLDDARRPIAFATRKTGISFEDAAEGVLSDALASAGLARADVAAVVATGVGRETCSFATLTKSEINCFGRGAFHLTGRGGIVIDIGGQDNKVIRLAATGRQVAFKMNRKCAAGTGAFLEEMSHRLALSIPDMNKLARETAAAVEIGSYCTVFTGTEIIQHIRAGRDVRGIIRGVYTSVVKRLLEMDAIDEPAILTGGAVASNPVLVDIFRELLPKGADVPERPQHVGAVGAAVYAWDSCRKAAAEGRASC